MNKRRGATIAAAIVLFAVVVPFAIYAVPAVVGANHSFVVLSGSMSPAIESGDAVIVEETDPATIQEGDVITFVQSDEESPTTHRVVGTEQRDGQVVFETKGDANEQPDPTPVPASSVIGTVVLTIPYIGYVIQFVNTPLGFGLLVVLPLGALMVSEVWQLAKRSWRDEDPTGGSSPSDAESGPTESETAATPPTVTLHPTDVAMSTIVLALVTPYVGYVAIQLRTPLTFSVAFAGLFTALAAGSLVLGNWRSRADQTDSDEATARPLRPTDLSLTTLILMIVTPYTGYVALQLRGALTFSVAFASFLTVLAVGVLMLLEVASDKQSEVDADTQTDDAPPEPTPDGGTAEEVE